MEERIFEDWYNVCDRNNVIPFPGNRFMNEVEKYDRRKRHLKRKLLIKLISKLRGTCEFAGCAVAFAYVMYQVFNWLMYV